MINFTMLTYKDLQYNRRLNIFKERSGHEIELSDFAILRGAKIENYNYTKSWRHKHLLEAKKTHNKKESGIPCGAYWTQDSIGPHNQMIHETKHDYWGDLVAEWDYCKYNNNTNVMLSNQNECSPTNTKIATRPAVKYSEIANDCTKKEYDELDKILEVEYGEYPQSIAQPEIQKKLEEKYQEKTLNETGKVYTTENEYKEYELDGKKYVRVTATCKKTYEKNGIKYKENENIWIEVEPIRWWVDEERDIATTERGFLTGTSFDKNSQYFGNFNETEIKRFLKEEFAKDIIPSKTKVKQNYHIKDIIEGNYNKSNIQSMTMKEKMEIITTLAVEVKEVLSKLRVFAKELDPKFGKIFDEKLKEEKEQEKEQAIKVKVRRKKG